MKKVIIGIISATVLVAAIFLVACNDEIEFVEKESAAKSVDARSYVIPIDEALEELYSTLEFIDAHANDNNFTPFMSRKIKEVEVVRNSQKPNANFASHGFLKTTPILTEDTLLYVVNFENDNGYAVLAADIRIKDKVLAIIDDGSANENDFFEPYYSHIDYDDPDLVGFELYCPIEDEYYVADSHPNMPLVYIYDHAQYEIMSGSVPTDPVGDEDVDMGDEHAIITKSWEITQQKIPMLTTVWRQQSPFNDKCPMKGNFITGSKRAPAGCVAIAVAQILAHNEIPANVTINGVNINWSTMKEICNISNHSNFGTETGKNMAATFVSFIGVGCNTYYTKNWSFAWPQNARSFIANTWNGYTNVVKHNEYDENKVINMLNGNKPVFLASVSGFASGHAWVIGGYMKRKRETWYVNIPFGQPIQWLYLVQVDHQTLVHCNWGWHGKANGYYVSGVFNVKNGPVLTVPGDRPKTDNENYNFTWGFRLITYNV